MKGSYKIVVRNNKLQYDITIRRNITVIQGDSGTGKTTLFNMIRLYENGGRNSGIHLECSVPCVTLNSTRWESNIQNIKGSIVFVDEDGSFVNSKDFKNAIEQTNNYYVIITREDLKQLPYSVNEIYGIRENKKKRTTERVYNETYNIYGKYTSSGEIRPSTVITEDSKAGNSLFSTICNKNGLSCIAAGGKDKIKKVLETLISNGYTKTILVVADGAAFGSTMSEVMDISKNSGNIVVYLPESFEWIILKSGLVKYNDLESILNSPENYIESAKYLSWERYFTDLLRIATSNLSNMKKYNKDNQLDKFFTKDGNIEKIIAVMVPINFGGN